MLTLVPSPLPAPDTLPGTLASQPVLTHQPVLAAPLLVSVARPAHNLRGGAGAPHSPSPPSSCCGRSHQHREPPRPRQQPPLRRPWPLQLSHPQPLLLRPLRPPRLGCSCPLVAAAPPATALIQAAAVCLPPDEFFSVPWAVPAQPSPLPPRRLWALCCPQHPACLGGSCLRGNFCLHLTVSFFPLPLPLWLPVSEWVAFFAEKHRIRTWGAQLESKHISMVPSKYLSCEGGEEAGSEAQTPS